MEHNNPPRVRSPIRSKTQTPSTSLKAPLFFIPNITYHIEEHQNITYNEYMEDITLAITNYTNKKSRNLFAVFDGHGGTTTAEICKEHLPHLFQKCLKDNPINIEQNFKTTFKKIDDKTTHCTSLGNTATVVFIENNFIYCANVGDSKCLLISADAYTQLSYDDKCNDANEMKRIQKEGGVVDEDERLNGVLAVSRAIGDHDLKHKGLISVPHFNKKILSAKDKFCVIASDGIWDEVSNDKAFDIAKECDNAKTYAKKLMETAIKNGSSDNISVIVIKLQ